MAKFHKVYEYLMKDGVISHTQQVISVNVQCLLVILCYYDAVSYTHLDVYKRQDYVFVFHNLIARCSSK